MKITKLVLLATPGPWVVPPSSQGSWWKLLGISLVLCHSKPFKHILESWPIKLPLLGDILPFHVPFPSGGRASRASRSSADSEQQRHRACEETWDSDGFSHDLQNTTIFGKWMEEASNLHENIQKYHISMKMVEWLGCIKSYQVFEFCQEAYVGRLSQEHPEPDPFLEAPVFSPLAWVLAHWNFNVGHRRLGQNFKI